VGESDHGENITMLMSGRPRIGILWLLLLLPACAWGPPPPPMVALTTTGFHSTLPAPGTTVTVAASAFGDRETMYDYKGEGLARDYVTTWLNQRGVVLVTLRRDALRLEQYRQLQETGDAAVRVGQLKGATQLIDLRVRAEHEPTVTVRATSIETGEVVWAATAHMPPLYRVRHVLADSFGATMPVYDRVERLDGHTISLLTCHALATAFGLRDPGTTEIRLDHPCPF